MEIKVDSKRFYALRHGQDYMSEYSILLLFDKTNIRLKY